MARTPSTMLELGTRLPAFSLPDAVSGRILSSTSIAGKNGTLVMFICNHCPFAKHVFKEIGRVARDASPMGVGVVAISSNDVDAYPDDSPEKMKELALSEEWTFPYLFDESQVVAKEFHAACTPDFFLFDAAGTLVYRGQLDDSRPGNDAPVNGKDLREAMNAVVRGQPVSPNQKPSIGCNIKWKRGNEPSWFASGL
ncbi:MAG TPA: thioredoxin family protein [bacterium]|nr:thioredoxin family protein [bacterium]